MANAKNANCVSIEGRNIPCMDWNGILLKTIVYVEL
jgi:hypothetical protein